jgi:hypothetical protein
MRGVDEESCHHELNPVNFSQALAFLEETQALDFDDFVKQAHFQGARIRSG